MRYNEVLLTYICLLMTCMFQALLMCSLQLISYLKERERQTDRDREKYIYMPTHDMHVSSTVDVLSSVNIILKGERQTDRQR